MTKILGIEITNNLLEFTLIDDEEELSLNALQEEEIEEDFDDEEEVRDDLDFDESFVEFKEGDYEEDDEDEEEDL